MKKRFFAKNIPAMLALALTPPLMAETPHGAQEWMHVRFNSKEQGGVTVAFSGHILTESEEESLRSASLGDRIRFRLHELSSGFEQDIEGYLKPDGEFLILSEAGAFDADGIARVETREGRGFMDARGNFLGQPRFGRVGYFQHGLAPVTIGLEWGYIDKTGALVIPANLDEAGDFAANGLAAARSRIGKGGSYGWGYIDRQGAWVIPPAFKEAGRFAENGVASVLRKRESGLEQQWQVIDATGKPLMRPLYVKPEPLFYNRFLLLDDRGRQAWMSQALIDIKGGENTPLSPYRLRDTTPRAGNLLWLEDEDEQPRRFLNPAGKIAVPPDGDLIKVIGPPSKSAVRENRTGTFFLYGKKGEAIRTILDKDGNFVARFQATRYLRSLGEGWLSYEQGNKQGLIHADGTIRQPEFDHIGDFKNGFAEARRDGKICFLNPKGQIAFQAPMSHGFDDFMKAGLVRFWLKENYRKSGLMNTKGEIVVAPRFDSVLPGMGEMVIVALDGKQGLVDRNGREVIPPRFDWIEPFNAHFAKFGENGKTGVIDRAGNILAGARDVDFVYRDSTLDRDADHVVIETDKGHDILDKNARALARDLPSGTFLVPDASGMIRFRPDQRGKYGILDRKGEVLIAPRFADIGPFTANGLARAREDDQNAPWGYIGVNGEWVIPPRFHEAEDFSREGLAWVKEGGWKYRIDAKGNLVFPKARPVVGKTSSRYGFMDARGEIVLPAQFNAILNFSDGQFHLGFARREYLGTWAMLDESGRLRSDFIYKDPKQVSLGGKDYVLVERTHEAFEGGRWLVNDEGALVALPYARVGDKPIGPYLEVGNASGQWGLADRAGKPVLPIVYEDIFFIWKGLILVKSGGRHGYVDLAGKWVIPPDFEDLRHFADNDLAAAKNPASGLWGYIDTRGKWAIAPTFLEVEPFTSSGFAVVRDKERGYRLIDARGNTLSPEHGGKHRILIEKMGDFFIVENGSPGSPNPVIFNREGKEVARYPDYSALETLENGLVRFWFWEKRRYGLIGADGKILFTPRFDRVKAHENGLTEVWEKGSIRFIDKTGKTAREVKGLRYRIQGARN
ncbi:MAG: WG repeat-containing protein [Zoogloeaceae bacterium]|jgi:hypothetical protein|nr:WG repeat-containing protein [Zoogloeaceae bacterium]